MTTRRATKIPERLHEVLHYEPATGCWWWLVATGSRAKVNGVAGCLHAATGYRMICVCGHRYKEHRLAWLYMTGAWPEHDIDHINGVRSDNRWANLREATRSQNKANQGPQRNNTSGFKGVCWDKQAQQWKVRITKDGRHIFLGLFDAPEAAHAAYAEAAQNMYGDFARAA